ncbi:helix-turn-helix domain-containing protein [Pontibacter sp. H249]|uniref:helix-turn-helix domain-containing protein n=1 Tax=Pontibacter sp. H249 TaxID=3133420 RepID=UPI0030BBDF3F
MNKEHLHAKVQQLHEEGYSIRGIAQKVGISKSNIGRIVKVIQDSCSGTLIEPRPASAPESPGTLCGPGAEIVPNIDRDASGTLESIDKGENEAEQAEQQNNHAFKEILMWSYKQNLQSSYRDFLYNMRSFLTNNLSSESLARELIQSRQKRVRDFIMRARGICLNCNVNYDSLFMAYALERLYFFLGQQPELEKTKHDLKIKAGVVLEQFIKQVERMDVFTPIGNGVVRFPSINTQHC